jgi:hypothetical protein
MPTELSRRELKFGIVWSLASGLILSAVIVATVLATSKLELNAFWMIAAGIGVAFWFHSIVQQVLLHCEGIPATWWWLTSLVGWASTSCFGMFSEGMVLTFAAKIHLFPDEFFQLLLLAMLAGAVFGGIQMWGCEVLRRRPAVWPMANSLAFAIVLLILWMQRSYPASWRMTAYLIGFAVDSTIGK